MSLVVVDIELVAATAISVGTWDATGADVAMGSTDGDYANAMAALTANSTVEVTVAGVDLANGAFDVFIEFYIP